MADLNALIAQGAQFAAPPDPFAQYAKMQQLEQGQTANQLNRMKMDEYERARIEEEGTRNYLRGKDLALPETRTGLTQFGKTGLSYAKALNEQDTAQATQQKAQVELLANKLKLLPDAYKMADTPEAYMELHKSIHSDPVLGPWLKSTGATPEKGFAQIQEAIKTGKFNDLRMGSMQSVAQLLDSMKPITVASGSSVYNPQTGTFTQAPESTTTDLTRNYTAAKNQGFVGSIFDYQQRIALAGTPASGARLKPIPTQINQAIIKNVQTLKQLDDTIALLGKNPDATGYKGYLPNVVLSRVDPEGVDVRAGIADIGSLVLHERSGAAVTAAESPRLLPFIPLATDENATAVKKLKRMREIAAADQLGLTETYGQDQGYKPNPLVSKPTAAPEAAPAIPTIYATNGKQRLQSIDGGKNWTPVK